MKQSSNQTMKLSLTNKRKRKYTKPRSTHKRKNMTKGQIILIGTITSAIILLIVLTFVFSGKNFEKVIEKTAEPSQEKTNNSVNVPIPTLKPIKGETIMINMAGFVPAKLTLTSGSGVNFANFSGKAVDIKSDDHPTHRLFQDLNIGNVVDGDTTAFKILKPGTYKYHNEFYPNQKGTIVVQ